MDDFFEFVRSRRAIRRYRSEPVPMELVERLLQTAVWSPSAHNRQPWRFAVLRDLPSKQTLATAMGSRLRADRQKDGDASEAIERDVARSYARITEAPLLILVCVSLIDMDNYPDARRAEAERIMAIQSVSMAAQTLWLAAHHAGLGVCWLCAPLFVPQLVRETLQLPADWEPQGLLTVGWPAEEKQKPRDDWRSKVQFI